MSRGMTGGASWKMRGRTGAGLAVAAALLPGRAWAWDLADIAAGLTGDCWVCDGVLRIGEIGLSTADAVFAAVSADAQALAGILMALWGLALAGAMFLPFGADARLWNEGAKRLFGFALLFAFLAGSGLFWDYLFSPLIGLGMGLALTLDAGMAPNACAAVTVGDGLAGAKAVLAAAECPIKASQTLFARGIVSGIAMILGAGFSGRLEVVAVWTWPARILQALAGAGLALVYLFGFLLFPFFFIDVFLRAVIMAMLAPLAALCWTFKAGRRLIGRALEGLWLSALTLGFVALATGLSAAVMEKAFLRLGGSGDWPAMLASLESGSLRLDIADQSYWMLLATGVIAIFMIRGARQMAAALGGAAAGEFSGALSAVAAMTGLTAREVGQARRAARWATTGWGNGRSGDPGRRRRRERLQKAVAPTARRDAPER